MDISTTILGHTHKKPITKERNNFYQYFEYGAIDEGYWKYDRMILQIEDYVDILKALHNGINFIIIFDNS